MPIVGMKLLDHFPNTRVEIIKGHFGDRQLTIRVTAIGHDVDAQFVFYTAQNEE